MPIRRITFSGNTFLEVFTFFRVCSVSAGHRDVGITRVRPNGNEDHPIDAQCSLNFANVAT